MLFVGWLIAGFLALGLAWTGGRLVDMTRRRNELASRIAQDGSGPWRREDQDFPGCKW